MIVNNVNMDELLSRVIDNNPRGFRAALMTKNIRTIPNLTPRQLYDWTKSTITKIQAAQNEGAAWQWATQIIKETPVNSNGRYADYIEAQRRLLKNTPFNIDQRIVI